LYKIRSADGNYLTYNAGDKSTTVNVVNAWQWNPSNVWWYLRKNAAGGYTISRDYKLEIPEYPDYSDALGFDQRFGFEGNIVILEGITYTEAKKWLVEPNVDGSYQIRAADGEGIVLTENGARQATIQTNGGLNTQRWFFESDAEAAAAGVVSAQTQAGTVSFVHRVVDYAIRDYSVDKTGNKYLWYASTLPSVLTFVNKDGSVTVCTSDEKRKTTHIYEYDGDLRERKTLSFQNEFGSLGAFTKDDDGNYYFFYGMKVGDEDKKVENMAIAKYDRNGRKIKTYRRIAETPHNFSGIQRPFVDGTCRLEISGSMLAVYFAEVDFPGHDVAGQYGFGHQGSHGFIIDKDSFEEISSRDILPGAANMPSHSHSFNQFILPIDGGFIFADHGDSKNGGFFFARVLRTATGINTRKIRSFVMPGDGEQFVPKESRLDATMFNNATYAGMGALAKTSTGYICAGAYGEGISNPRNVFTLTFDDKMITQNSDKKWPKTVEGLKNSLRIPTASPPVYLTKYTREIGHAGHPKMVSIGNGRFLLLWELFRFSAQSPRWRSDWEISGYLSTFALAINEKGEAVSDIKELKGFRLNMNDVLRYNPHNGNVYWAVNNNGKSFTLYAFNCNQ
ncbi:MAG: hypothetical protein FWF51_12750, partial [Chitinivibrionia bacterium]|nr:hypothetical protein [Chitinivibrionia bacterium]